MRNKNLLIGTLVLGLIALAVVRLTREAPKTEAGKQPLVAAALLDGAKSLTIKANNKSVTVEKSAEGWTVKEKLSLPADVENRLLPLIRGLQKANNFGQLTANPKRLEKLGLADTTLTLVGPDGKPTTIQFGKPTEDGLGASARLAGQEFAVRTDFSGYLEGDPLAWVDLTLFAAKPAEIKSIGFEWKDGKAAFSRKELGTLFEGKEGPAIEDIVATLATIRAADAVALDDKDAAKASRSADDRSGPIVPLARTSVNFSGYRDARASEPMSARRPQVNPSSGASTRTFRHNLCAASAVASERDQKRG
jgi:hypothetical protein